jgi:hypothetical protein
MTGRGTRLLDTASGQIAELYQLLCAGGEDALRLASPRRQNLGDGTVGATAEHVARAYQMLAQSIRALAQGSEAASAGEPQHHPGYHHRGHDGERATLPQLLGQLSAAAGALAALAEVTDRQLDSIPPAGAFRYCDGRRTLEQVVVSALGHQQHHVDALKQVLG